jgi:MoaA/NifB/PqqE/SkfB family radical SAM enzyme
MKDIKLLVKKIRNRRNLTVNSIVIELTTKCNSNCSFCPQKELKIKKHINKDHLIKIVDHLEPFINNNSIFNPVGLGEPLLYPNLIPIIKIMKERVKRVFIDTNGIALNEDLSKKLLNVLDHNDRLLFSLNANTDKTYHETMGVDKFELVVNNIESFLILKGDLDKKVPIIVNLIRTQKNNHEIEGFKEFWNNKIMIGDRIVVRELSNWAGANKNYSKQYINWSIPDRIPCITLWKQIVVDIDGNLHGCCPSLGNRYNSDLKLFNILELSREEFVKRYKLEIQRIQKFHKNSNWNYFELCRNCFAYTVTEKGTPFFQFRSFFL